MNRALRKKRTTKRQLVNIHVMRYGRVFQYDTELTEANCMPGTWKHLNNEISFDEAKRLDALYMKENDIVD